MKRQSLPTLMLIAGLSALTVPAQGALIGLFDYAFNIDGVVSNPTLGDPIPAAVDLSAFDDITGLGILTISLTGSGSHFVDIFLDHEIDEAINTFFNEYGAVSGSAAAGQSWEIDEPGYVFGDIYDNFLLGTLDNTNAVPATFPDDVSMAMGWDFILGVNETALISLAVSETSPSFGFYLSHTDLDSNVTIYMTSALTISPSEIPEPASLALMGIGLAGMGFARKKMKA